MPPPATKKRRWIMPLLIFSLAINLLVAGLVVGAFLSPDGPHKGGPENQRAIRGVLGEPFFRALPGPQRRAMVQDIVGKREQIREGREALRERVERFLVALRAENFNRTELARLLSEQREAAIRRQSLGETLLLDRLEAMAPEERSAYADALEKRLQGLKKR